jgi:hypothetical protein
LKRTAIERYLRTTISASPHQKSNSIDLSIRPLTIMRSWLILAISASTWGIARSHLLLARDPFCAVESGASCDPDNDFACCSDANTLMICQGISTWYSTDCGSDSCVVDTGDVSCCDCTDCGIAAECNPDEGTDGKLRMRNLETSLWN